MPQSLSKILVHIIFSTKNRYPYLQPEIENDLFSYLASILNTHHAHALLINGTTDHIHILADLARTISVSDLMKETKKGSFKWIKTKGGLFTKFHWQTGYGIFSVSPSKEKAVRNYISNQKEHHKTVTFQDELRRFLEEYGVTYDERYVWD